MTTSTPRPEYPRPHFDRSHSWLNLNGEWDFCPDPSADLHGAPPQAPYPASIIVPFAWETRASGVAMHWLDTAWYRRIVSVPEQWAGQRTILHFGAVHHEATVWVNRCQVAHHTGGYLPFEADISDALGDGEQEIVVRVHAPADKRDIAHGKQRSLPRTDYDGVCFTPSSGIWQSVWLEGRPATHLTRLRLRPNAALDAIVVQVTATGPSLAGSTVSLRLRGTEVSTTVLLGPDGAGAASLTVPAPRWWSPADPHLYDVDATLASTDGRDIVSGYTGLRCMESVGEELYLNGERFYVRGVLDQGYWPETGITAPSDEALRRDLQVAREAGYNLVRKHLKLEDARGAYHADVSGMLLWAEPASPGRFTPKSVTAFTQQLEPMVTRDGNSPAIVIWGLYNEEWGLDWDVPGDPAKQQALIDAYDVLHSLDDSRPIVENSGWTHVKTDLLDWHYYDESAASWGRTVSDLVDGRRGDFAVKLGPDHVVHKDLAVEGFPVRGMPNLNSEYGTGFTSLDRGWQLRWQTQELRRHDRLSGYVYTELYDIEHESAGLLDSHREAKDLGGVGPSDVNGTTVLVLDVTPVAPGRDLLLRGTREARLAIRASHHGATPLSGTLTWAWSSVYGPAPTLPSAGEVLTLEAKPFVLSEAVTVTAALPAGWVRGRLHLTLTSSQGVITRSALDVDTAHEALVGDDPLAREAAAPGTA